MTPQPGTGVSTSSVRDAFIGYASEDREVARALARALTESGLSIWFDEYELRVGDSLSRKIDEGLRISRCGIVILSHSFFAKNWPQSELGGLKALEKRILPIWHEIDTDQVKGYSPTLADIRATRTALGLDRVVKDIIRAIRESDPRSARERVVEIRQEYLDYPGDTPDVDYMAAVAFKTEDDFALDLVRHILGMANAGGGHIVIGVREDQRRDPLMDDDIADSYAASLLSDYVGEHTRGTDRISLRIHKHQDQHVAKVYPIIDVDGFERRPFFCRSTKMNTQGEEVLKEGALYIRSASTRTVEIASPEEWDRLITLCVQRQQDDLLVRFADLMERVGFPKRPPSSGQP